MKQFLIIQLIYLVIIYSGYAQNSTADSLRNAGNLNEAIKEYKKVFDQNPENRVNTYNLACAYALTYLNDSAFHYLDIALKNDNSTWALTDCDLIGLTKDNRWEQIETQQMKKFQDKNGALKQPEYAKLLYRIIMRDQSYDYYIEVAKKFYMKNGYAPHWYYPIGEIKKNNVDNNYETLMALIEKYGWPRYSTVGKVAADAPLLVINHHEDDNIRKKYIDKIKEACLNGEGSCFEYARIQDRILVNDNKEQLYGMQFRYNANRQLEPFPIKDPKYVDKRRKEIGLASLKKYLKKRINYDWNVKQKK